MNNYFSKSQKIGDEVYVYKNFLNKEEIELYVNLAINAKEWTDGALSGKHGMKHFAHPLVGNILKRIQKEIVPDGMFLEFTTGIGKMVPGVGMVEHSDDCPHCKKINDPKLILKGEEGKRCVRYGMVVYFGEFTGGEIYYPKQGIVFSPDPGDLIIHSTSKLCKHGVKPVKTGIRYTFAPYIVEYLDDADAEKADEFWYNLKYL